MTGSAFDCAQWLQVPIGGPAPSPRGGHCSVSVGSKVFVFGGSTRAPIASDESWVLDATTWHTGAEVLEWHKLTGAGSPQLAPRAGCTATVIGAYVYIYGGQDPSSDQLSSELIAVSTVTWDWHILQAQGLQPPGRHSHSAGCVQGHLLIIFGGAGNASLLNDLWTFDTRTQQWQSHAPAGPIPRAREMHAGITVGPSMYLVFGGRALAQQTAQTGAAVPVPVMLGDIALLNFQDMTWTVSGISSPLKRCSHSAIAVHAAVGGAGELQHVLVYGGFDGEAVTGDLILIDPTSMTAEVIDDGPAAWTPTTRFAHSATCLPCTATGQQAMLIFGGMTPQQDLNDMVIWTWNSSKGPIATPVHALDPSCTGPAGEICSD